MKRLHFNGEMLKSETCYDKLNYLTLRSLVLDHKERMLRSVKLRDR